MSRYKLSGNTLVNPKFLFQSSTLIKGKWHFGGRLVVNDNHLYLSTGDGFDHKHQSQNPFHYADKILRLNLDGSIPPNNPFADGKEGLPEVFALGVRNPQGMMIHPETREVWINEHGPQGGDEINIIHPGENYGWLNLTRFTAEFLQRAFVWVVTVFTSYL